MLFTTLSALPTRRAARSSACCASTGLVTTPVSTTPSPTPSMWMSAFGSDLLQRGADAVEIASDGDVVGRDLLAFAVEEEDVGLADRGADDIGALRGADDRVGDLRIGDEHVLDLARQVDHHRLADAERQKPHRALDDGGVAGAQIARGRGRTLRHQRQGGDDRERRGADRLGPQRSPGYSRRSCLPSPQITSGSWSSSP